MVAQMHAGQVSLPPTTVLLLLLQEKRTHWAHTYPTANGAQDALQALHAQTKAYTPETIKLQEMLKTTILPQIEDVFQNASRMLIVR